MKITKATVKCPKGLSEEICHGSYAGVGGAATAGPDLPGGTDRRREAGCPGIRSAAEGEKAETPCQTSGGKTSGGVSKSRSERLFFFIASYTSGGAPYGVT